MVKSQDEKKFEGERPVRRPYKVREKEGLKGLKGWWKVGGGGVGGSGGSGGGNVEAGIS